MTPHEFISKWKSGGDERKDAQPFFEDLCRLVGHPTPREADPKHEWFTYEYGANKTSGGNGWADVWKKECFGWEAKGTHKSLERAYEQLKMYADALQNPPLLIVSDLQKFEIHTNFTNSAKTIYKFTVEDLAEAETRRILSAAFNDPEKLRPGITRADITRDAAGKFADLASRLRAKKDVGQVEPKYTGLEVAHFLNRLIFCMFAEDIGILPDDVFSKIVASAKGRPGLFETRVAALFTAMMKGGDFGFVEIEWFNGGLFQDAAVLQFDEAEIEILSEASELDWSEIDPSIFGTLFERGLDPKNRQKLGAHYTDPATIMKIVDPVVIQPLQAEWESTKELIVRELDKSRARGIPKAAQQRFNGFLERIKNFRVLDPACGSGNFLYLSLRSLKDFENRVIWEGEALGLGRQAPSVGPANVLGIELNEYAAELARITIWIGEIQWMIENGHGVRKNPILQSLETIECRNALINSDATEAAWPSAEAIVGNPPFLGDRKMLRVLGEEATTELRACYAGRVAPGMDLVCYWFEKSRQAIEDGSTKRVGLVSTQAITGVRNREILRRVKATTQIFKAWKNETWVGGVAAVRMAMTCFGEHNGDIILDDVVVDEIRADLTAGGVAAADATPLAENRNVAFQGIIKSGSFDVSGELAREWLSLPTNPNGRKNSDVVRPWMNGVDITRRASDSWIVDFGLDPDAGPSAMYEAPFQHVHETVKPQRAENRNEEAKNVWWRLWCPRPEMRGALGPHEKYIATSIVAKHRVFAFLPSTVLPSNKIVAIARSDNTSLGILSSAFHVLWAHRISTRHGVGNDPSYNPETCFQTFPFPEGLTPDLNADSYSDDPRSIAIAEATRALMNARAQWLNPEELMDWVITQQEADAGYPHRAVAKPGKEAALKKRTLNNLYNDMPQWLVHLHSALDTAVAAAYGWDWPLSDDEIIAKLFALNQVRSA